MVDIVKTDTPYDYEIDEKFDAPKEFGDLVASDSVFAMNGIRPLTHVVDTLLPW